MKNTNVLKLIIVVFCMTFCIKAEAFEKTYYFPTEQVNDDSSVWYQGHLEIMGESSLYTDHKIADAYTYRYLLLDVYDDPLLYRVDIKEDGTGRLKQIKLIRPELFQRDYGKDVQSFDLSKDQVDEFLNIVNEEKFFREHFKKEVIRFGGMQIVVEGVKGGKYQLKEYWASGFKQYPVPVKKLIEFIN